MAVSPMPAMRPRPGDGSSPDPLGAFAPLAKRIEGRLDALLTREQSRWAAVDRDVAHLFDSLSALLLAPAKRLRPAFCYWGFVAAAGDPGDPADQLLVDAGAAFELLHAFALFHDDVMDGSAVRRGYRTCHLAHADRHEAGEWTGEARRFGEGVAILVGDLAFVYADELMRHAPSAAWAAWNELRLELNVGQYLDILGTARRERDEATAERIARYKSGKYTVERPLHVGALLADPESHDVVAALSAYGLPLGDAFQLRDDMLGAFGDEQVTGKPVGDDLREGKPTPLLALATSRATVAQRRVLARVGDPELTTSDVSVIQDVFVGTGAVDEVENRIARLVDEAVAAIGDAPIAPAARLGLRDMAYVVGWRDR
jgi:geranylgeranyl diphosphate synthase, type I